MYTLLIILLLGGALLLGSRGLAKQNWSQVVVGTFLAVFTGLFWGFLGFWGEALWFQSIGYEHRFWKVVLTSIQSLLLVLVIIALITSTVAIIVKRGGGAIRLIELDQADVNQIQGYGSACLSVAGLLFVLAWGKYLSRFHLMYSALGAVTGPG